MAQTSYPLSPNPVCVIGSEFVAPYPFELIVVTNSSGDHLITDVNHKIIFKVKPCNTSYHEQRMLLDADHKPIVLIREKMMSVHSGWRAYKGDGKEDSEMIFSTRTPKVMQWKTNIHVFLGNKTSSSKKNACDFKITGSWSKRSCGIYMGDHSQTIIAQMHKIENTENIRFIKDKFTVKISPYVDYAFVITLIAILEAMKSSSADEDDADEDIGDVVQSVGVVTQVIGTIFS
ncbi:hypothetical protein QVD17_32797 [Tagetes erecta]|uniref:Uncharacterized protein n=1 Tax=Tagetes erecta TaxID=13708 RepID=A0AAD8NKY8_TARER|nr:hypothetical protein QVD17_32797 [Tagetes erecta]